MEVGQGNGTSWPTALDVNSIPEVNSPAAGKTKARKEVVEDLTAICLKVEEILGTSPQGALTDVKTFLQTHHQTDGTHKSTHGPHKWLDEQDYANFTAAVAAAPNKTLVIARSINLDANTVIPASVSLMPLNPGVINANGFTLTINGPVVGNPMHQWLSGFAAGEVLFGAGSTDKLYPIWAGASPSASSAVNSLAYQIMINAATKFMKIITVPEVFLVDNLTGGDFLIFEGMNRGNDNATIGSILKTSSRVFNVQGLNSTKFKSMGFTGTAAGIGTVIGCSSAITGLGLIGVRMEDCKCYDMNYSIDSPAILSEFIGNHFLATAMRLPGGAGAANNKNTWRGNIWQLNTGKDAILEIGTAAGGSQPQGGQADRNTIEDNDFENNNGRAILLNGALNTVMVYNWFEDNNVTTGGGIIKAVVSGGVNNNLIVIRNRFASTRLATVVVDHGSGPVHEFSDNIGSNIGVALTAYSSGTIYRVFGNFNFGAAFDTLYPTADHKFNTISVVNASPFSATTFSATEVTIGIDSFQKHTSTASVSTTTTIFTSEQHSGVDSACMTLVMGTRSGIPTTQFVDIVLWMTNGGTPTVISSQTRGTPSARTYTVSGLSLQLAMATNTYVVGATNFRGGHS